MKRLLSVFLSVCLVMNFFVGISPVVQAEVVEGETLTCWQFINTGDGDEEANNAIVDLNASVTLSVEVESSVEGEITYQWLKDSVIVTGEEKAAITVSKDKAYQDYTCIVNNGDEDVRCYFYLYPLDTLSVSQKIGEYSYESNLNYVDGRDYIQPGQEFTLTVEATSTLDTPNYTYQWYYETDSEEDDGTIEDATGKSCTLTKKPLVQEKIYCNISDGSEIETVTFFINAASTFDIRGYINETVGTEQECETGEIVTMKAEPYDGLENVSYTYSWECYDPDEWYIPVDWTEQEYSVTKGSGNELYRCAVSDGNFLGYVYFSLNQKPVVIDGWQYQVYDEEATIIAYTGTEESVTIPHSVYIDGEFYYIRDMGAEVFNNLATLKTIDCNGWKIGSDRLPLVVDCPNLTTISMPGEEPFEGGTLISSSDEELKPTNVTIKVFPDVKWLNDEMDEVAMDAYCASNGFTYNELEVTVSDLHIEFGPIKMLPGESTYPRLYYKLNGIESSTKSLSKITWNCDSNAISIVDGEVIAQNVSKDTKVKLSAEIEIYGEKYKANYSFTVLAGLVPERASIRLVGSDSYTLSMPKMREYEEKEGIDDFGNLAYYTEMVEKDLPESTTVTYVSGDESIATVSASGVITPVSQTIGDKTTITATYTVDEKSVDFEYDVKISDGSEVDIYSWNSEIEDQVARFIETYPQYADKIEFTNLEMGGVSEEYFSAIDAAMEKNDTYAPEIILWDHDALTTEADASYITDLASIGFDEKWYANAYAYTKANGTINGKLKAVTWQATPGGFVYRADIAEKVFGTSDPSVIQTKVKDWDTFMQSAAQVKSAGYKMLSGQDDIKFAISNSKTSPLVNNGTVDLTDKVSEYLTLTQQLYSNGYTDNSAMWSDEWTRNFDDDVLGYFGCTWFVYWSLMTGDSTKYKICNGPSNYYWGGTYLTATNTGANNDLVALFLKTITCDDNFMYEHSKDSLDFVNNATANQMIVDNGFSTTDRLLNDPYPVWMEMAKNISSAATTKYDNQIWGYADRIMTKLCSSDSTVTTVEAALSAIAACINEAYPELTVNTIKTPVHTHTLVTDAAVAATCTTPGKTEGSHCSTCNEVIVAQTEIPAKGHTEVVDAAVAPTCTEAGKTEGSHCSVCNVVIKEQTAISATGYRSDKGTVTVKSTTKKHGKKVYKCTICKETLKTEKLDKLPEIEDKKADYKAVQDEDGEIHIEYDGSKKKEKEVKIPDTIKDENGKEHKVTVIADDAFKGDKKIEEIKMGKNITEIGDDAFSGCKNLEEVTIGKNVTEIGDNAFKNCSKLEEVKIPSKVKEVGDGAFNGCKNLEEVTIGKNVTTIGDDAFKNCKSLDKVTLPSKVKEVGDDAFNGCKDLKDVKLGKKVEELGDNAFKGCSKLTEITLPANLDLLGKNIFYGCKKLKKLIIQSKGLTTKTVEKNVFKGLPKTTTIYVPKSKLKEYKSLFKKKGLDSKVSVKGK